MDITNNNSKVKLCTANAEKVGITDVHFVHLGALLVLYFDSVCDRKVNLFDTCELAIYLIYHVGRPSL